MWRKSICLLALLTAGWSLAYPAVVGAAESPDPTLVGWWKLDEGIGTSVLDSSSYHNDSNQTSTPLLWVTAGRINGALEFNGTSDFVEFARSPSLDLTDVLSMTLWVKTTSAANGVAKALLMKGEFTYGMRITEANDLEFRIFSGGYVSIVTPVTSAFDGVWHHLAGVYDGAALKLYVDGQLKASAAHTGVINKDNNYYVNFGRNSQGDSNHRWWYAGTMDDVRLYHRALTEDELLKMLHPELAMMPSPADGAKDAWPEAVLSWVPGSSAQTHDVYLGTVLADVTGASRSNPRGVLVSQGQSAATYDPPGRLAFDQTYYWRIDEVDAPPGSAVYKGNVWSFTVPYAFPITQVTATASSSQAGNGPENTVNGSGLDAADLHSTTTSAMWLSDKAASEPAWIQFAFDRAYKLNSMWVWNYNASVERVVGFGFQDVTVEYSVNGTDWTLLADTQFNQAPSQANYAHNTEVDFKDIAAQYVRLTAKSNFKGRNQYGLSEVRFLCIPTYAQEPEPASGQTGLPLDVTLGWRAGREVASQQVCFGADQQAVADGTALAGTVTESRFAVSGLNLGTTYYWNVTEVNQAETPNSWTGAIWSFSTTRYLVIDDMESYTDDDAAGTTVYQTWVDGYGSATNGSQVGHSTSANGTFCETTIVHGGSQSMPLYYDNTAGKAYSAAERSFSSPQDWSEGGATTLTLYFYGDPNNSTSAPIWVKLTDQGNHSGKVTYGDAGEAVADLATAAWHEWNMPFSRFGVDATRIKTMSIGFGTQGGVSSGNFGLVYIDDIRVGVPAGQ
jgi:hypothetical protein